MRDHLDDLAGAAIAAVTFTDPERLAGHRRHLGLPFPLLADPRREVYRQFGLGRGAVLRVYGWGTLRLYAKLLRRGRRLRRATEDTLQLGGDFVIGPDGRLVAGFWPDGPDDRPGIDALIGAVEAAGDR